MKFRLGDLIKESLNSKVYIIIDVIDFIDYTSPSLNGEIEYGVMQIHPVQIHSEYSTISHNDAYLYYADGSPLAQDFHRAIKEERIARGFTGVPDFVKMLNTNMKSRNVYLNEGRPLVTVGGTPKKESIKNPFNHYKQEKKAIPTQESKKPFPMNTVDECLDAMNSADLLYEMFGDKKYLKMKDNALAKLVEITS